MAATTPEQQTAARAVWENGGTTEAASQVADVSTSTVKRWARKGRWSRTSRATNLHDQAASLSARQRVRWAEHRATELEELGPAMATARIGFARAAARTTQAVEASALAAETGNLIEAEIHADRARKLSRVTRRPRLRLRHRRRPRYPPPRSDRRR